MDVEILGAVTGVAVLVGGAIGHYLHKPEPPVTTTVYVDRHPVTQAETEHVHEWSYIKGDGKGWRCLCGVLRSEAE